MPIKKVAQALSSWSFSRYNVYKSCPFQFKLKFIDKIAEPGNDAMRRGAEIHDLADQYIKGQLKRLPAELKLFADEFKRLKKLHKKFDGPVASEDSWSFTKDWDITRWDDWVACWLRIKVDCAEQVDEKVLIVSDWKTGKFRAEKNEEYLEQLELYALGAFMMFPKLQEVRPRLVYLDVGTVYPTEEDELIYRRKDVAKLKKAWEKRVVPMFKDKMFAPRANNNCRYCFYRKANKANGGGQCKY